MTKQTLSDQDRKEIVLYRLDKAEKTYKEAVEITKLGFVNTAANRLYYSAYYAVCALLIANGITTKTHSGVKIMFGLHFIKSKVIDNKFGSIFSLLFSLRMTGDYEDRKNLDLETEVRPLIEPTRELIDVVSKMAREKIKDL